MARIWKNVGRGTLNTTVTAGATTWIVDDPNLTLPVLASGETTDLGAESELVLATGPSSGTTTKTYTVTRGYDNTTAAAHTAGVRVFHPITAAALTALRQSAVAVYEKSFTGATSVTVSAAEHGFGHSRLLVQVYDDASPRAMIQPDQITISIYTYLVTVTLSPAATGVVLVSG